MLQWREKMLQERPRLEVEQVQKLRENLSLSLTRILRFPLPFSGGAPRRSTSHLMSI